MPSKNKNIKFSIIITTRNRFKDLLNCVNSIKQSKRIGKQFEIIIVDDCSQDETRNLSQSELKINNLTIVHNPSQKMMVKSRNIGAKISSGKYLIFIDDDNIVDSEMIYNLVSFAENHSKAGAVGPSMYYSDGTKYLDYQKINFLTGKTTGFIDKTRKQFISTDGIPNVFLVKKEVFDKCGYFDETLIQTFTEPDFSFFIRSCGFESYIFKKAITYHQIYKRDNLNPRALGGSFLQKAYCLMRNRTVIVARYGSFIQKVVYLVFFSWLWPLVYSILVVRQLKLNLIKLYWLGFFDGVIYLLTGKLNWSFRE